MPDTSKSHSEKVADEFGHWAQIGKDQAMEKGHGHFTDEALSTWNLNSDHHVLDMGCGNGWALRRMIQRGAGSGVGVDISAEMVAKAIPPGRYLQAHADTLPLPDACFSHILSIEALYYAEDPASALKEWSRVAKPGAKLMVLVDLYRDNPCHLIWCPLLPFSVQVLSQEEWVNTVNGSGWTSCTARRILDPRGPLPEAEFVPTPFAPSYADYLAEKQAGTLCLEAVAPA